MAAPVSPIIHSSNTDNAAPVSPVSPVDGKLARISLTDRPDPVDSLPTPPTSASKADGPKTDGVANGSIDNPQGSPNGATTATLPGTTTTTTTATATATATATTTWTEATEVNPEQTIISCPAPVPTGPTGFCALPDEDETNPVDFEGVVQTNNRLPSAETIDSIGDYMVLDKHGKTHPFKSLYTGKNVARRVLVIFVRHFFCGNCQEYLRTLTAAITPDALLRLPISTFIAVVGCGSPDLIDMYATETNCPFPIYTDPTRKLYDELEMVNTLSLGAKPAYIRHSLAHTVVSGVVQGLKQVRHGLATKAGDQRQVGGEFLFEPYTAEAPAHKSPFSQMTRKPSVGLNSLGDGTRWEDVDKDRNGYEEKRVSWCHRMRTTRDHAEIPELMEVLGLHDPGLDGEGMEGLEGVDRKRWSKALEQRKGTGLSLASEMTRMSNEGRH